MSLKTRLRPVDAPPVLLPPSSLTVAKQGNHPQKERGDDYGKHKGAPKVPEASLTPALLQGLGEAAAQLGDPSLAIAPSQLGGRLRAVAKNINAVAKGTEAPSAEALWLAASAVTAAEHRTAGLAAPASLDHAFDAAWGALARLETRVRSTSSGALLDALLKHARAGGTLNVARIIEAAGEFRELAAEISAERGQGPVGPELMEAAKALSSKLEKLLKKTPEEPYSRVDLDAWKSAIPIIDQGTKQLYDSSFEAGERARNKVRPPIPADAQEIDPFQLTQGWQKYDLMAEKLLAMASEHAFYTKPDGNNPLVVYPSDRELPGAIETIVKRYEDSSEQARQISDPKVPDETLHSLRASVVVALDRVSVPREVIEAASRDPRSLEQLQQTLGTSSVSESGLTDLRHPVEIERWAGYMADRYVEYCAGVVPPEKMREETFAMFDRWVNRPYVDNNYAATAPMWKDAIAELSKTWFPKLSGSGSAS